MEVKHARTACGETHFSPAMAAQGSEGDFKDDLTVEAFVVRIRLSPSSEEINILNTTKAIEEKRKAIHILPKPWEKANI